VTDVGNAPPRAITEQDWAEIRRAGLVANAQLVAEAGGIPDVLLGYQKRGLETTALSPVIVWEKSRRIGATWGIGADAVLTAAATRSAGGMDALYIGYNLDMAREFIDVCAMWSRAFNEAVTDAGVEEFLFDDGEADSKIAAFRIRFASGHEIVALASRPRSLRGRQGYVIVDEAAFHDDLDALLQAALALLIWGGKVLVISTHYGEDNAFNRLVQDCRAGRKPYKVLRTTFDDALRDGLYQRICFVRGETWSAEKEAAWRASVIAFYGEGADEELFCVPSKGGGLYLPRPLIETRMSSEFPVFRLERPAAFAEQPKESREADIDAWCRETLEAPLKALDPALVHAFGEDFGRVGDLTVIAPIALARTTRREVPFVVELRNIPFEQQRQVLFFIADRLPRLLGGAMDATGNGAYLAEVAMQRYGALRIAQLKLNAGWYLENFPPLKAAFEDGMILFPADSELLNDLAMVRVIGGVPQIPPVRTSVAGGKKRHADFAVALVLAYFATRVHFAEYGYETVEAPEGMDGPPWLRAGSEHDVLLGKRADRLW
jgi:phage FluMu gp28-like protein